MADNNKFSNAVSSLFEGLETFAKSKTVVGEPIVVDDTTIVPLINVSVGMGANASLSAERKKNTECGALGAKLTPTSLLIVKDGCTRIINIKDQNVAMKAIDLIPEVVNRFTAKTKLNSGKASKVVDDFKKEAEK